MSRSSTLRRLLTPAGSKPLWFVSLTSVSRGLYGTSSPISCVVHSPKCVLVALSLHPGSTLASCSLSLFALPSPVFPLPPLTPSAPASSVLMTSSFSPLPRLTFRWPSMLCMGCSLALLLWCRPHQIRHLGLRSSARPP